ncbi:MAG: hypothetical protein ACKO63_15855 [Nodosilinea sp.]
MAKPQQIVAGVFAGASLLGVGLYGLSFRFRPADWTEPRQGAGLPAIVAHHSTILLQGAIAPLTSLRLMQRAIAASSTPEVTEVPTLAILNAPITTTGLGPIRIGMTKAEIEDLGFTLLPISETGNGDCQYYRLQDHSEPIGLMAIQDQVLRVDIWPGSLTPTRSGVKIGSSEADLIQYYDATQLKAVANPLTLGKTITFTPKDQGEDLYRLVFETDQQGRVVQYRAGQFPSVTWPQGCF